MDLVFDPRFAMDQATRPKPPETAGSDPEQLRRSCQEFEAIFIQEMFKAMRATIPDGGLIPRGNDQQIFQDLLDQNIAMDMARRQGLGLADALFRQLQQLESGSR